MSADEYQISMAGGDGDVTERLASIRKSNDTWLQSSVSDRNDRNTKFLLDLIEEQQAKLDLIANQVNASEALCRMNGRDADLASVPAAAIRAALEATP